MTMSQQQLKPLFLTFPPGRYGHIFLWRIMLKSWFHCYGPECRCQTLSWHFFLISLVRRVSYSGFLSSQNILFLNPVFCESLVVSFEFSCIAQYAFTSFLMRLCWILFCFNQNSGTWKHILYLSVWFVSLGY